MKKFSRCVMSPIPGRMTFFTRSYLLPSKDDEDANTSMKEVTLEDMSSAAKEVDGTGTVDTTSNAAERLKLNQATSATAGQSSNQQVTVQRKRHGILAASLLSSLNHLHF